jgi:tetratricopeptide (TPR) repeat protein
LMAHVLRRTYHLYRGDVAAAKREEDIFDDMAAQYGSRWVADSVSVLEIVPYHLAGDVLGLKRALHRVERLAVISQGLATQREIIRAMYEGHRGRPEYALEIYAANAEHLAPFANGMWAAARGHQAECLNTVGRHREALALCTEARAHLTAEDRVYVFAYQQLERESALALAGLGQLEEATTLCEMLLDESDRHSNELVRGLLHHDRAQIACVARDTEAFELHLDAAKRSFVSIGNPALLGKVKRLFERGRALGLVVAPRVSGGHSEDTAPMFNERAEHLLHEAVQTVGAASACVYSLAAGRIILAASYGNMQITGSFQKEIARIVESLEEEPTEERVASVLSTIPTDVCALRTLIPLVACVKKDHPVLFGILVLGQCDNPDAIGQLNVSELALGLWDNDETSVLTPTQAI